MLHVWISSMFYAQPFIFCTHMHAIYIMPSHSLKHKHTNSYIFTTDTHTSISQGDLADTSSPCQQPMYIVSQTAHPSPTMLSNPISSPLSDAQSFDVDNMYGSDPDPETICLRPILQSPIVDTDSSVQESLVHCYVTVGTFARHGLGSAKQRHWVVLFWVLSTKSKGDLDSFWW